MKVLVIGSKGFIGTHLSNNLKKRGCNVIGVDVIKGEKDPEDYYCIDTINPDFYSIFQRQSADLCINCSGAASVPESLSNPFNDYFLNTVNVYKILNAIKELQPECRFINLSSAAVYGNPQKLPISETTLPDPVSPYGFHKFQAEYICKEFYDLFEIKTCSLRIFSVYGIGLKKQLFWDLLNKARTGNSLSLFGSGYESRDFIYISDLIRAINIISEYSSFKADIVNVANGEEILIKDAVATFFDLYGGDIKYSFSGHSRKGDPVNWRADISKLRSFGYKPSVDISTGLNKYIEYNTRII